MPYKSAERRNAAHRRRAAARRAAKVPIPCVYCDHVSKDEAERKRHMKTHPLETRVLTCPHCGKVFHNNGQAYLRHTWSHRTVSERFWARVEKLPGNGCWIWLGCRNKNKGHGVGYGRVRILDRLTLAHVFAYEEAHGPVPEGLELDHLCRNHLCVRPAHLEAVTHRVNTQRMHAAKRTGGTMELCHTHTHTAQDGES